jgi:hypothetical protein
MLVALLLIALLTVIGATSLSIAGVDQRVATYSRRHMIVMNAADAGTQHARYELMWNEPANEGWDTGSSGGGGDTGGMYVPESEASGWYGGTSFPMNQGTYDVDANFVKCSLPPAGYSTEQGRQGYRSDYWDMTSHAWFEDATTTNQLNSTEGTVMVTLRKVVQGSCKIR